MGPDRYNFGGGSPGAIVSCRDQDGGSKRSYRDLSGVAFPGPGRSEKIARFCSVLVWSELPNGSNGVLNRRQLSKKSWFGWVRLSPFGSRWVRNGSEDAEAIWHPDSKRTSVGGGFSRDVVTRVILPRFLLIFSRDKVVTVTG